MSLVFVYRNLHKNCWSVKCWSTKLVIDHCDEISLDEVKFKVSEKSRLRVNSEKRKNVHAGVFGIRLDKPDANNHLKNLVTYNPYTHKNFKIDKWDQDVHTAGKVYMKNGKVYI